MTATNHALTGAIIGLLSGQPLLAIPAAIASHFVCDALPHYGSDVPPNEIIKTKHFRNYLVVDGSLCITLVLVLVLFQPQHWLLASICAFLATSPDLLWINRYVRVRLGKSWKPSLYAKFAGGIQWFEKPIGSAFEVAWLVAGVSILTLFLR